jgi:hypothetical protein
MPSLNRCFKDNRGACCNSVIDGYIDSQILSLFTPSCNRRYPALEDLFCFGCNSFESLYSDSVKKKIFLCEDFANYLWNYTSLNQPSTIFDSCAFKTTYKPFSDFTDKDFIYPSIVKIYLNLFFRFKKCLILRLLKI